jgi:hypothetical protein
MNPGRPPSGVGGPWGPPRQSVWKKRGGARCPPPPSVNDPIHGFHADLYHDDREGLLLIDGPGPGDSRPGLPQQLPGTLFAPVSASAVFWNPEPVGSGTRRSERDSESQVWSAWTNPSPTGPAGAGSPETTGYLPRLCRGPLGPSGWRAPFCSPPPPDTDPTAAAGTGLRRLIRSLAPVTLTAKRGNLPGKADRSLILRGAGASGGTVPHGVRARPGKP